MSWFQVPVAVTLIADDEADASSQARLAFDELEMAHLDAESRLGVVEVAAAYPEKAEPLLEAGAVFVAKADVFVEAGSAKEANAGVVAACLAWERKQPGTLPEFEVSGATETADPRLLAEDLRGLLAEVTEVLLDGIDADILMMTEEGLDFAETVCLSEALPEAYAGHYTPLLLTQFRAAVAAAGAKLQAYPDTYLATTAEELAGHALIDFAGELLEGYGAGDPELRADLGPDLDWRRAQAQLEEVHELAFEDWDVLMLFDPSWDGLGEAGEPIGESLATANLAVSDWFTPFRPEGPGEAGPGEAGPGAAEEPGPELGD